MFAKVCFGVGAVAVLMNACVKYLHVVVRSPRPPELLAELSVSIIIGIGLMILGIGWKYLFDK